MPEFYNCNHDHARVLQLQPRSKVPSVMYNSQLMLKNRWRIDILSEHGSICNNLQTLQASLLSYVSELHNTLNAYCK